MVTQGVDAKISKIIKTKTKTEDGDADRKMEAELGEYKGLKHALAVVDFETRPAGCRITNSATISP